MHPRCGVSDSVNWFCMCRESRHWQRHSTLGRLDALVCSAEKSKVALRSRKAGRAAIFQMHLRCVVSDSVNWFCACSECRDMPRRSTLARLDVVAYDVGKLRSCIALLKTVGSLDCPEAWCLLHLCCVVSDSINASCTCKQRRAWRHPPTLTRLYAVAYCVETRQLHGSAEVKAAGSQNDREA